MYHDIARPPGRPYRRPAGALLAVGLAAALVTACTGDDGGGSTSGSGATSTIPQPAVDGAGVAPDSERVDLAVPTFSNPTNITNPLFPVSQQHSVLMLGQVDGEPFRTEVTLLPEPRIIEWQGQRVETLVSQYVAFHDGRIAEVAYDLYAQADDGSVWYFGEDVFNFEDGAIVDTHGTWIAGLDGPAAMIMPAEPKVGDVYRPENIPGLVFEEVTVKSVEERLDGPFGPIDRGLLVEELHLLENATEEKSFGPGYGEFYTAKGSDVEALAMAVPTDAVSEPIPAELTTLADGADAAFEAAGSGDWDAVSTAVEDAMAAWEAYQAGEVPRLVEPLLNDAVAALAEATTARDAAATRQAAIDVARLGLDLQLRYRPAVEVDIVRFDLWLEQLLVDAAAEDEAAVSADFFAIDYVRDRIMHALDSADAAQINTQLEELLGAIGDGDFAAVAEVTQQLRETMAGLQPA